MKAFQDALVSLENLGAVVDDTITLPAEDAANNPNKHWPPFQHLGSFNQILTDVEFPAGMAEYLKMLKSNPFGIQNVQDILDFTKDCPAEEYAERDCVRETAIVILRAHQI